MSIMLELKPKVFEAFPILKTKRCTLRNFSLNDIDEFYALRTDPDVRRFIAKDMDASKEVSMQKLEEIIESYNNRQSLNWVIEETATRAFIGTVGYWRIELENSRAEIGYSINKSFWQKGIMTEVLSTLLPFAFKQANIHSIMAVTDVENVASQKLLAKTGFRLEAHHRENWYYNGKFYDSLVYGMLEGDLEL
jgi:ribosomal-protein-alanine N-acetyltransferase